MNGLFAPLRLCVEDHPSGFSSTPSQRVLNAKTQRRKGAKRILVKARCISYVVEPHHAGRCERAAAERDECWALSDVQKGDPV